MSDDPISISPPVPILRIFSVEKAREFYVGYLGFEVAWEHRFEPNLPLYMQVERGTAVLHLSEHHGDGTPGTACFVPLRGLEAYRAELAAKDYDHQRPGIEEAPWGSKTMTVTDPFGNELRFDEAR
jgi:catechol 2,3-dioxygenase-like lactoylglutathione lyase family enzyme